MVKIQDTIEKISGDTNKNKSEKIERLYSLLKNTECDFLIDFDDTVTDYRCLLYSKYKYLRKRNLSTKNIFDDFLINEKFLSFFKKKKQSNIIIISANNLKFLKEIIKRNNEIFDKIGINIIGIIGNTNGFNITAKDKKQIIPEEKIYISDIMEYKLFKNLDNYICLDDYSFLNYIKVFCIKIYYYLLYIIKNV